MAYNNEKEVCKACGNLFPADSPTCPTCKWQVKDTPKANDEVIRTLRRMARALESMRYYMWEDRKDQGRG